MTAEELVKEKEIKKREDDLERYERKSGRKLNEAVRDLFIQGELGEHASLQESDINIFPSYKLEADQLLAVIEDLPNINNFDGCNCAEFLTDRVLSKLAEKSPNVRIHLEYDNTSAFVADVERKRAEERAEALGLKVSSI